VLHAWRRRALWGHSFRLYGKRAGFFAFRIVGIFWLGADPQARRITATYDASVVVSFFLVEPPAVLRHRAHGRKGGGGMATGDACRTAALALVPCRQVRPFLDLRLPVVVLLASAHRGAAARRHPAQGGGPAAARGPWLATCAFGVSLPASQVRLGATTLDPGASGARTDGWTTAFQRADTCTRRSLVHGRAMDRPGKVISALHRAFAMSVIPGQQERAPPAALLVSARWCRPLLARWKQARIHT